MCVNRTVRVRSRTAFDPKDYDLNQVRVTPRTEKNFDNGAECHLGVVIDHTYYQAWVNYNNL